MTPTEFRDLWTEGGGQLVVYSSVALSGVRLPAEARDFLQDAGLPESAAPYLDFKSPRDSPLPTASAVWQLPRAFVRYRLIGSNGFGDPICIDEDQDGAVIYLNHDNEFLPVLVNTSVPRLAESLLAFRELVRAAQGRNGEDAYLDGNIPQDVLDSFVDKLKSIDDVTLYDDAMWQGEVTALYTRDAP